MLGGVVVIAGWLAARLLVEEPAARPGPLVTSHSRA
jgi:hypothetical protein